MASKLKIVALDLWQVGIPLARTYHLSSVLGDVTHSRGIIVRITLENGICGWGEGNPQLEFDGYTQERAHAEIVRLAREMIGRDLGDWIAADHGATFHGAPAAAIDIACFDALGKARGLPVWRLLGDPVRQSIDVIWPTSNGTASEDLEIIRARHSEGFRTFMLKMGSQPIAAEIERTREVLARLPADAGIMVDANQGWSGTQAQEYVRTCSDLPVIFVEQPLPADDLDGLSALRQQTNLPISVDESLSTIPQAAEVIAKEAADVFSIKVSKNGGLASGRKIAALAAGSGRKVFMNSMIELGICQAASLHLAATVDCLLPCGHAYMSTLRMADDVSNFSSFVSGGRATVPDRPGLGIEVNVDKVEQYRTGHVQIG